MKLQDTCSIVQMRGRYLMLFYGKGQAMEVNESFYSLWKKASEGEFTPEELSEYLLSEYEISKEQADKAVSDVIELWEQIGLLER